jgi:hypothetical protein
MEQIFTKVGEIFQNYIVININTNLNKKIVQRGGIVEAEKGEINNKTSSILSTFDACVFCTKVN